LEFKVEIKKVTKDIDNLLCLSYKKLFGKPSNYLLLLNSISKFMRKIFDKWWFILYI